MAASVINIATRRPGPDPIFDLIERHRAAWQEYCDDSDDGGEESTDEADRLMMQFLHVQPTTVAGCAALLAYCADWIERQNGSFPNVDGARNWWSTPTPLPLRSIAILPACWRGSPARWRRRQPPDAAAADAPCRLRAV
jgi:hypothetical protein